MNALPGDRRDFLKTTLLATAAVATGTAASAASSPVSAREYYELRAYRLRPGMDRRLLDGYLEKALIPALHARGIGAVGVFTEPEAKDGPAVWVLIPHPTLESVAPVDAFINTDPAVQGAAGDYFAATSKDHPAYERVDSWLLLAFAGLPQLAVPALKRQGAKRIFEMRTYDSYNEIKALKKVEMFNAGEIELMQQLNMSPVFYGQALIGRDLPHLTYMLCSPDRDTHKKSWDAFFAHPVWLKLKNDPQYADTVSKVTSRFFEPLPYSEI
ncbi:MAG TPA: NIPSNAP family protein [Lacunisphaera sp.]|nr:NIPSNAP family protein [Lacunisphaera sp.]